ncbi:MAG: T9SS type B sorting domain-containing protein [Aureispira sp.]|nr:T9SS type B sorting domain-containing protein [Aureispira sp.]
MRTYIQFWMIISCLFAANLALGQSPDCINAFTSPICGAVAPYPANSDGTGSGSGPQAPAGNNYDCLGTQGNPNFFTITIDQSGPIDFDINNSAPVDVDFILWGPYYSLSEAQSYCGNLGNGPIAPSPANVNQVTDCSYAGGTAPELVTIPNAQSGEIYILMVTNYANTPTNISTTATNGTGTLACPCQLDYYGFSMLPSPINNGGQLIDTSGGFGQYLICPGDDLGISISASSNTVTDTLSLYATFSTISNYFSTFALLDFPVTPDSTDIFIQISPDATEVGVHDFFIAINNNGAGGSCFDQIPIRTIVPGVSIPDFDICSGQILTPEADTFPVTSFGSATYSWSQVSGPTVSIAGNTLYNPTITIPTTDSTSSADSIVIEVLFDYGGSCGMADTFVLNFQDIHIDVSSALDSVCVGDSSQLVAILSDTINPPICDDYDVTSITFAPIAGSGTLVNLGDDAVSAALPIGFDFTFFCNTYTSFVISSNGFMSFDLAAGSNLGNDVIPDVSDPQDFIALGWDDLDPDGGAAGTIEYFTTGTAPNRTLVVNFINVPHFGSTQTVTSQVILYETTNVVEIHNTDVQNDGGGMTQGIENATGTLGFAVPGRNDIAFTATNDAYRFAPKTYGPFYNWTPAGFVTDNTISNPYAIPSAPTTYNVVVSDGECMYVDTVRVEIKGSLSAPVVTCGTATTNSIDVSWTDIGLPGGGFYEYSIDGGATWVSAGTSLATTIGSLTPNTGYTILIRGNDGLGVACSEGPAGNCTSTTLPAPTSCTVTVNLVAQDPSCDGSTDGCVFATVTNNVGGFSYNWSNGSSVDSICGLGAGMYTVTITDTINPGTPGGPGGPILLHSENFDGATFSWTLNQSSGANPSPSTNNIWAVSDFEGGVAPNTCGIASNGNNTMHVTCQSGLFCAAGGATGAAYNAATQSNYRSESPVFSTVGSAGITVDFDVISSGDGLNDNASLLYNDGLGGGWQVVPLANTLKTGCCSILGGTVPCTDIFAGQGFWEHRSYTLPASCDNNPSVQIAFNWTNNADNIGDDPSAAIDNIVVIDSVSTTGTPPTVCTVVDSMTLTNPGIFTVTVDSTHDVGCAGNDGAIFITATDTNTCRSNIVTINEIFVNPTHPNDGSDPNTAEFIELLGPPGADISCYVFTDGDWTLTIPAGTTIPSDGIFTIGNDAVWGAGTFDLDAENCGCFTDGIMGDGLLIMGNNGEYLAMFDGAGSFLQGVQYDTPSAGNTAPNGSNSSPSGVIYTAGTAGCPDSVIIPAASFFEIAPGASNGQGISRNPDGNLGAWTNTLDSSVNACNAASAPTFTYLWSDGQTTEDATGLPGGSFTVTVTNSSGCTVTASGTVNSTSGLVVTLDSTQDASCSGVNNGAAFISVAGGTPGYTFLWSDGSTNEDATGLLGGNYSVTVSDASGCSITSGPHTISEATAVVMTVDSTQDASCSGQTDGMAFVSVTGGTPGYTFLWSNGTTNEDATGLTNGTYTVTATDANGCTDIDTATISVPSPINISFNTTTPLCGGSGNEGCIEATVTGGNGNFGYSWSNGASVDSICGLNNGIYTLTVTDTVTISGSTVVCVEIDSAVIAQPDTLIATIDSLVNIGCAGDSTGLLRVAVTGGTMNYDYLWSNGDTLATSTGLMSGNYCVTVTDANSCTATICDSINEPFFNVPQDTFYLCAGDSVQISVNTNVPIVSWTPSATLSDTTITNPFASPTTTTQYYVTARNADSTCSNMDSIVVIVSNPVVSITPVILQCSGDSTGCVTATTTGGFGIYTYNWSNGNATNSMCNLPAGNYMVTATDSLGCVDSLNYNMTQPSVLIATVDNTQDVSCGGGNDGAINVSVAGGTPTYSYDWSIGSTNEDLTNLAIGSYTLVVTDANNCTDTVSTIVGSASGISISDTVTHVTCSGGLNGAVDLVPIGGTQPYTYLWSNGDTTQDLSNVMAGIYTVTLSDNASCSVPYSVTITQPAGITVTLDSSSDPTCGVGNNGSINMTVTGGTSPVTLLWSNGATTEDLTNLSGGTYTLTATDSLACAEITSVTLTPASDLTLQINTITGILACDQVSIGELQAVATSSDTITYAWNTGDTTTTISGLAAGSYTLTVTTSTGCTETATASIIAPVAPTVNAYINNPNTVDAIIELNESFTLNSGNDQTNQGVTYAWSYTGPSGVDAQIIDPTSASTSAMPDDDGDFVFVLLASATTSGVICTDQDTLNVIVEERFDGVPDAFTPNEDSKNDLFRPIGLDATDIIEFKVYNRWGQLMYDGDELANDGWDGTFNNKPQPRDVYIYVLRFKERGDEEETLMKGPVTLIR